MTNCLLLLSKRMSYQVHSNSTGQKYERSVSLQLISTWQQYVPVYTIQKQCSFPAVAIAVHLPLRATSLNCNFLFSQGQQMASGEKMGQCWITLQTLRQRGKSLLTTLLVLCMFVGQWSISNSWVSLKAHGLLVLQLWFYISSQCCPCLIPINAYISSREK